MLHKSLYTLPTVLTYEDALDLPVIGFNVHAYMDAVAREEGYCCSRPCCIRNSRSRGDYYADNPNQTRISKARRHARRIKAEAQQA